MTIADAARAEPWTATDRTFGARLALVRQHMGWGNLKEAAVACGIPVESWRAWERDGVMPQGGRYFDICAKIALSTGCDYGWLVDRRPSGDVKPAVPSFSEKLRAIQGEGRDPTPKTPLLATI